MAYSSPYRRRREEEMGMRAIASLCDLVTKQRTIGNHYPYEHIADFELCEQPVNVIFELVLPLGV